MDNFAQNVGWFVLLGVVMVMVSHLTYAVLAMTWRETSKGVYTDEFDALDAMTDAVATWFAFIRKSIIAVACATVVFSLLLMTTSAGFYSSLGYAAMSFAVIGVLMPHALRNVRSSASKAEPLRSRAVDHDSDS